MVEWASTNHLQTELGAAPVSAFGVVPDGVIRTETDPLRNRPVLLGLFCQRDLGAESLVGRLNF
jgi:hypothetical protein